jgi:4-amino-4-deoxychorismate lyase
MEWSDPTIAEGLLLDTAERVIEGVSTNIFLVHEGVLKTPNLSCCGVSGVTRERVLDRAILEGLPVRVGTVSWQEVLDAEEALLVNSLIGAWQIRSLGSRTWVLGSWTARIRDWLDEPEV